MFKKIFKWGQGRHTAFAATELFLGSALAWFHRLDMNYVALCTVVQGMVLGHSIKEDVMAYKTAQQQQSADIPPGPANQPNPTLPQDPPNG